MVVGNGADILKNLMKVQSNCPNCGTTLTFEDAAQLGRDHGVSENAIMCYNCRKVFNVNIMPDKMEILDELTKYDFSDKIKKEEPKKEVKEEPVPEVKKEASAQTVEQTGVANASVVTSTQTVKQQVSTNGSKRSLFDVLENNSFAQKLFYKTDAQYGLLRLSKTKTLSELWFILIFFVSLISLNGTYGYLEFMDVISSIITALIFTIPVFIFGWLIARYTDKNMGRDAKPVNVYQQNKVQNNANQVSHEEIEQKKVVQKAAPPVQDKTPEPSQNQYFEKDNVGTNHDTVEKANAYWLGERFAKEEKDPFTMYMFSSAKDAEDALLELPYIHKASDTGKLICDDVLIYGYYEVGPNNYEAIVCGKDLTKEQFSQAEDSFKKHGGKLKNNLEPEKSAKKVETPKKSTSSVKFREKFNKNQYTYECYDADTKSDAVEFLKGKQVNQRLYYICVYTPEGDFGRDIDGIYQM